MVHGICQGRQGHCVVTSVPPASGTAVTKYCEITPASLGPRAVTEMEPSPVVTRSIVGAEGTLLLA
jgi:hypothetical protein